MKLAIILLCAGVLLVIALEISVVGKRPGSGPAAKAAVPAAPAVQVASLPEPQEQPAATAERPEEKLDLELLGTLVNGKFPSAFIKDLKVNTTRLCKIGSVIQGATVVGIGKGEATLTIGGKRHVLVMTGRRPDGSSWPVGTLVDNVTPGVMLVNTGEFAKEKKLILQELRKVKIRPQYEGRKPSGLRLEGIEEGGIITSAGIRNNDVIREINDQKVDSYQKALQVFLKARATREIRVNLVREGEAKQLSFRLQ